MILIFICSIVTLLNKNILSAILDFPVINDGRFLSTPLSRVGCVGVNVLATGPKGYGFKPGRGHEFLRAIQIRSTTSFGWEVKPEAHVVRFYGMLKNLASYDRDATSAKFKDISHQLPASLLDVLGATRERWWMNRVLELRWERTVDQKWPQCLGRFVRYRPVRVTTNQ
jgi:hypothetical protein